MATDSQLTTWLRQRLHRQAVRQESVQTLWSGYGEIVRVFFDFGDPVIVKSVNPPDGTKHPRGWNTDRSHARKLESYRVEHAWYAQFAGRCGDQARVPKLLHAEETPSGWRFVLEDLNANGFPERRPDPSDKEMKACLRWLARFHALFFDENPEGLWSTGTYWHLDTRPDELEAMKDLRLKEAAGAIDRRLSQCAFQTLVHGDAKVANFCFGRGGVAAVDFQYVGGGVGIKDVAYFLSSCLFSRDLELKAEAMLDVYFGALQINLQTLHPLVDANKVVATWRALYPWAWADFYRFLAGWSPGHWKMDTYSRRLTESVLDEAF